MNDFALKIVDAKCEQLKEAVSSARVPFFLALTWTLIWSAALYNHEFGYTKKLIQRFEEAVSSQDVRNTAEVFQRYHSKESPLDEATAKEMVKEQLKQLVKKQVDEWYVEVPGIPARIMIYDFDVIGHFAAIFLAIWGMFASRREYLAMLSIVNVETKEGDDEWYPDKMTLRPSENTFGERECAYAYYVVANKFLFLTSKPTLGSLMGTSVLILLPVVLSVWNIYTDLRDISVFNLWKDPIVHVRTLVSVLFSVSLLYLISAGSMKYFWKTSALLNAWYLATTKVWQTSIQQNENVTRNARAVDVDRKNKLANPRTSLEGL
jgi:hypothetical protein